MMKILVDGKHEVELDSYFPTGSGVSVFGDAKIVVTYANNYCKGCKHLKEPLYITGGQEDACGGCNRGSNNKEYK